MPVYRLLYSLLGFLVFPSILIRLFWRSRKNSAIRKNWQERLGFIKLSKAPRIWLHAVSVGETVAAKPLIEGLLLKYPEHKLLISNTTATGHQTANRLFADRVEHCFFPYDINCSISRFLSRSEPALLIVMETEIWPNLLHQCKQRKIPVLMANARLSERSTKGYAKILPLIKPTLSNLSKIACRSLQDSHHFKRLGASSEQLAVVGNIKFDIPSGNVNSSLPELKEQLGLSRKIWVAASTHDGEDEIILSCYSQLKQHNEDLALVLVPRHPERFDSVFKLCENAGYITQRRSSNTGFTEDCDILLGDSMGEMDYWFASADIVFLGGSLVDTGGHNPLEAIAYGAPVVSGPSAFNFNDVYELLYEAEVAWVEQSAETVTSRLKALLELPENELSALKVRAARALEDNAGATQKILQLSHELINSNS